MVGESRRQGSSTGGAGADGVLDCGFSGVYSSYTRIRTHLIVLDAGSTSIIFHQRKTGPCGPILVGGDGGSRTHVQEHFRKTFSERSRLLLIRSPFAKRQTQGFAIPWVLLRYREITQEVPACMTPGSHTAGDTGPTRGAELCSQCEIVVCFSVSFERVLFTWITATARLSLFHTPVETFTPPQVMKSGRTICRSLIIFLISPMSTHNRSNR